MCNPGNRFQGQFKNPHQQEWCALVESFTDIIFLGHSFCIVAVRNYMISLFHSMEKVSLNKQKEKPLRDRLLQAQMQKN